MRELVAIAVVFCLGADYPRHRRVYQPNLQHAQATIATVPFLDVDGQQFVATSADDCTGVTPTSQDGGFIVSTSAGSKWCTKADYSLVLLAADKLRIQSDRGVPAHFGPLVEVRTATNLVTSNRDLSDADWTKTSMTCAKTATGVDGVANSASTCTATGTNGTVSQAITVASAARNTSVYVKRISGSGVVSVSRDNGSTYTAITSSLSSTIFKRVVSLETESTRRGGAIQVTAMGATAANPTVIFRLGTSGDVIAFDLAQDEAGTFPSSPITTTHGATAARAAEGPYVDVTSMTPQVVAWNHTSTGFGNGADFVWSLFNDASNREVSYFERGFTVLSEMAGGTCFWAKSGSSQFPTPSFFVPAGGPVPMRCANNGTTLTSDVNGGVVATAATVQPPTGVTRIYLGGGPGGSAGAEILTDGCINSTAANCPTPTNRAPGSIVGIGDSTMNGNNPATTGVNAIGNLAKLTGKTAYNWSIAGSNCASAKSVYETNIRGRGFASVIVQCGTNDIAGSSTAASVEVTLQALYDEIRADGPKLIAVNVLPRWGSAGFTAGMETQLELLNTWTAAYCVSTGATCVETWATLGGQGGDPKSPLATLFAADLVHPNDLGSAQEAVLYAAAQP